MAGPRQNRTVVEQTWKGGGREGNGSFAVPAPNGAAAHPVALH